MEFPFVFQFPLEDGDIIYSTKKGIMYLKRGNKKYQLEVKPLKQ